MVFWYNFVSSRKQIGKCVCRLVLSMFGLRSLSRYILGCNCYFLFYFLFIFFSVLWFLPCWCRNTPVHSYILFIFAFSVYVVVIILCGWCLGSLFAVAAGWWGAGLLLVGCSAVWACWLLGCAGLAVGWCGFCLWYGVMCLGSVLSIFDGMQVFTFLKQLH